MKQPDLLERRFVLYFDESRARTVGGRAGDLVGLPVGQVTDVGLTFNPATLLFRPRVALPSPRIG